MLVSNLMFWIQTEKIRVSAPIDVCSVDTSIVVLQLIATQGMYASQESDHAESLISRKSRILENSIAHLASTRGAAR